MHVSIMAPLITYQQSSTPSDQLIAINIPKCRSNVVRDSSVE